MSPLACQFEVETSKSKSTDVPPDDPGPFEPGPPPSRPDAPAGTSVRADPFHELIVTDNAVVAGEVASNALGGTLSFRSLMRWLSGDDAQALLATRDWLGQWETVTKVGPYAAPVGPRPDVNPLLIAPWLSSRPSAPTVDTGGAYDSGSSPSSRGDGALWERAPFRLLAVVNRLDLALDPCLGPAGELRIVYSVVDVPSGAPLEMTVIAEIPYPKTRTAVAWARAWHQLSALGGESFAARLAELVNTLFSEADPYTARVRTNEVALGGDAGKPWELREFHVEDSEFGRRLRMNTLLSTPREDAEPKLLSTHVVQNAEEIGIHAVPLPEAMQSGAAHTPRAGFSWAVPGVDESLRFAFSRQTCNGCHGGDTTALPFQHIAADPSRLGQARLSRFLSDPGAPTDELRRRQRHLEQLLDQSCPDEAVSPYQPSR